MFKTHLAAACLLFAAAAPLGAEPVLTGSWSGFWEDCRSGHHGPLKACLEPCGSAVYRATFTGRFFKVIPFRYSATLNVTAVENDRVYLSGTSRVPLFGEFQYQGSATATDFLVDFCSRRYQGRFVLKRCE